MQRRLVVLDLQHIVRLLRHDGLGDLLLAAHRIDGHGVAFEVEQFQQLRDGRDLVGLLVHRELAEEEPRFGGPGTDQVQGVGTRRAVVRAAQRLAVDGHLLADQLVPQLLQPALQAEEQGRRVEPGKDAAEGVMRRDAVGQLQEAAEEVEFGFAVAFDIDPGIGIGDQGAEGDNEDVLQDVAARACQAGVGKTFKVGGKLLQRVEGRHPSPPGWYSVLPEHHSPAPLTPSTPAPTMLTV